MTSFLPTFDRDRREQPSAALYWAYGSNLCVRQMTYRCPTARKLKALPVYGAKLVFRGVADVQITDNPADVALGGLWRITRDDERALDRYEGVSTGMYTKEYFYIRDRSRHYHKVMYYKMASEGVFPPSEGYLYGIVEGYADFGLDLTKLDEAVQHSWNDKNKTEDMRQRYLRNRPILAHSIEQAKRPMISAPKPKPARPIQSAQERYSTGAPARDVPKHQPSWPSIGPHSKLLPKPQSANVASPSPAPPLESLFPQDPDEAKPLTSYADRPLSNYTDLGQWCLACAAEGYAIESEKPNHTAFEVASGLEVGFFSEDDGVGFLPQMERATTDQPLPHGED